MRVIAFSTLRDYADRHPTARMALSRWHATVKGATYATTSEIQAVFSGAKVLSAARVRFPIAGGSYRLIVAFDFEKQIAFVKFLGTHAEYDAVDALTVSQFLRGSPWTLSSPFDPMPT